MKKVHGLTMWPRHANKPVTVSKGKRPKGISIKENPMARGSAMTKPSKNINIATAARKTKTRNIRVKKLGPNSGFTYLTPD